MPDHADSFFDTASRSLTPFHTERTVYDYGDIEGVTSMVPDGPLFADSGNHLGIEDLAVGPWSGGHVMPDVSAQRLPRI